MSENNFKLIDLDQMEASVVRRRLRSWTKTDERSIIPFIEALLQKENLANASVIGPRYETNVYPLYYYWRHGQKVSHKEVYNSVFKSLPPEKLSMLEPQARSHVGHTVDSEVDILVEDIDYFIFIEAKEVAPGRKAKFEKKGGVHQLVNLYVQGKILAKTISKPFFIATIGANKGERLELKLNPVEQALLQLVDESKVALSVFDLSWSLPNANVGE